MSSGYKTIINFRFHSALRKNLAVCHRSGYHMLLHSLLSIRVSENENWSKWMMAFPHFTYIWVCMCTIQITWFRLQISVGWLDFIIAHNFIIFAFNALNCEETSMWLHIAYIQRTPSKTFVELVTTTTTRQHNCIIKNRLKLCDNVNGKFRMFALPSAVLFRALFVWIRFHFVAFSYWRWWVRWFLKLVCATLFTPILFKFRYRYKMRKYN